MSTTLMRHQDDGAIRLVANPRYALFHDTGTGKTVTTLTGIVRTLPDFPRTLVVAPLVLLRNAWEKDAAKFTPQLKVCNLRDDRKALGDVDLINFDLFRNRYDELVKRGYDRLVVDESSKMKNHDTKISKMLREFSQKVRSCWLLSGTPAPNDGLEYWAQIDAIDPKIFGNYYQFRSKYGICEEVFIGAGQTVQRWRADPRKMPAMLAAMSHVCHVLRKEDCLDLPDMVDEIIEVELSDNEQSAYLQLAEQLAAEFAHTVVGEDGEQERQLIHVDTTAAGKTMKLRQVTSGFYLSRDERTNEEQVVWAGFSKLNALKSLIGDTLEGQQVVVWALFRADAERIRQELDVLGGAEILYGGLQDRERNKIIDNFISGKKKILVANTQSAGHGLTFVNCRYAVYYGLDYSAETHLQSRARLHRIGQAHKVTNYYLLAKGTIDEQLYEVVTGKIKASDAALIALRRATEQYRANQAGKGMHNAARGTGDHRPNTEDAYTEV